MGLVSSRGTRIAALERIWYNRICTQTTVFFHPVGTCISSTPIARLRWLTITSSQRLLRIKILSKDVETLVPHNSTTSKKSGLAPAVSKAKTVWIGRLQSELRRSLRHQINHEDQKLELEGDIVNWQRRHFLRDGFSQDGHARFKAGIVEVASRTTDP